MGEATLKANDGAGRERIADIHYKTLTTLPAPLFPFLRHRYTSSPISFFLLIFLRRRTDRRTQPTDDGAKKFWRQPPPTPAHPLPPSYPSPPLGHAGKFKLPVGRKDGGREEGGTFHLLPPSIPPRTACSRRRPFSRSKGK